MSRKKKVLVQAVLDARKKKPWFSLACESAALGFKDMGYNVQRFTGPELGSLKLRKDIVVKASIQTTRRALDLLGVPQPANLDIPEELKGFTKRKIWETTMGAVREAKNCVFIKPAHTQKAFRGHVYYSGSEFYGEGDDLNTFWAENSFPVLASTRVVFNSEWRAYILDRRILGVYHYQNLVIPPPTSVIQDMVDAYTTQPRAYSLDIGYMRKLLSDKEEWALVEVNEGFALGNYGLPNLDYAKMVEARWEEMMRAG